MQGFQIAFFTQHDCRHGHAPMAQWLLWEARKPGLSGGALMGAGEGFGHGGKLGSAHFFERADQPLGVTFAANGAESDRLFQRLHDEKFDVFYAKTPIEFGMTSQT